MAFPPFKLNVIEYEISLKTGVSRISSPSVLDKFQLGSKLGFFTPADLYSFPSFQYVNSYPGLDGVGKVYVVLYFTERSGIFPIPSILENTTV